MSVQSKVEWVFGHEDASNMLWNIAYLLIGGGALLTAAIVWQVWFWDIGEYWYLYLLLAVLSLGMVGAGFYMIETGQKDIPKDPPSIGVLTIWGKRMEVIVPEGTVMTFKHWPLKLDFQPVVVEQFNKDFCFTGVWCAASPDTLAPSDQKKAATGGSVSTSVSITLAPNAGDPHQIIKFLNNGGMDGVIKILEDMLSEGVRHTAIRYDWETFIQMKAALTVMLLVKIADVDFRQLPKNGDGLIDPELMHKITPEQYHDLECIADPITYLFPDPNSSPAEIDTTEKKRKEQEIETFLRIARLNDVADIMDLGVKIARLNVPKIEPEGQLEDSAEDAAREKKEREKENMDTETNIQLANKMVAAAKASGDDTLTFTKAMEIVRIDKGRAREFIVRGSGSTVTDAAAIFADSKN